MSPFKQREVRIGLLYAFPLLFGLAIWGCEFGAEDASSVPAPKNISGDSNQPPQADLPPKDTSLAEASPKSPGSNPSTSTKHQPPQVPKENLPTKSPPDTVISKLPKSTPGVVPPKKVLFDGWPKPRLAILLSGEQHGYFEPCGCSSNQLGGMARRGDLLKNMQSRGWKVAGLDVGGSLKRSRQQSKLKFQTTLAALKDLNYLAIGMGVEELRLGPEYLLSQHVFQPGDPKSGLPFLSANAVIFDTPDIGTPLPYRVVTAEGIKLGITSIIGNAYSSKLKVQDISFKDPAKVLPDVLAKFKAEKTNINILLSHAPLNESRALAKQFPQIRVILSAGSPEDPDGKVISVGKTMILNVGRKGKHVGVLGLYPFDKQNPLRFELVTLDEKRFKDDLKMVEHMRYYQGQLKDEKLAYTDIPIKYPSGAKFVGADVCGGCHTTAYDIWKKTPHASAFESLKHPREGMPDYGISRIYDPECLACHVTGWHPQEVLRYQSGFVNEAFASNASDREKFKLMRGQQCEGCHGPGSEHIRLINDDQIEKAAKEVRVTLKMAEEKVCAECHDLDNSPKFEFKKYWKEVEHKGMD